MKSRAMSKTRSGRGRRWDLNSPEPMDVFGGNEYDCTLRQVWQAEAYNDDCLRFVDFYGTYTTETEVNHDMDLDA